MRYVIYPHILTRGMLNEGIANEWSGFDSSLPWSTVFLRGFDELRTSLPAPINVHPFKLLVSTFNISDQPERLRDG